MKNGSARFELDEMCLRQIDDMVVAEKHFLAERARLAERQGNDPVPIRRISSRRHFMAVAAAGLVGAGVLPKIVHAAVPPPLMTADTGRALDSRPRSAGAFPRLPGSPSGP